ncbi:MAG: DEAD/DEAH box helicase, partial [candidate division Zixibacteria bacterium]|nr:DEAD/DEAH box helicase [candidate division Zixibacteria bacterium]
WDTLEATWEEMFSALVEYRKVHGDCNVPQTWPENPKLGHWISVQRRFREKGRLSKERIRRLVEIGFIWDKKEAFWEEMFSALAEHKKAHGDCRVPHGWPENPKLS